MRTTHVAFLTIVAGSILSVSALAEKTNLGANRAFIPCPNVLTPGTRGGPPAAGRMLYAPSEADDPAYRAAIAGFTGGIVDYFDARAGTPDAATLNSYDCVHTWANYAYADNVGFGDNLADYVDQGGRVILGAFCTYTSGNFLSGRIMTSAYCPVVSPSGSNHFSTSGYAGDGTSCIYNGVTAFDCLFRDFLTLQGAGVADGHYNDGEIAHAYRPDFAVIYSNGSGCIQLGGTGDWALLLANACGGCKLCTEDAARSSYGTGFPGTSGIPTLTASGDPELGNSITLDLSNSLGATTAAVLFFGLSPADIPSTYGAHLLVLPSAVFPLTLPGAGASLPVSLPADSGLCGLKVYLQGWESDAGATKGVSATRGLELDLGS